MNINEFEKITTQKIIVSILMWVVIIFTLFLLNQCSQKHQLKRQIAKIRKEIKGDYESKIKEREKIIEGLKKDNQFKKELIEKMNYKIDSLDRVKSKIKTKYIFRIQEIKNMDSEKIKNYWNEQLN